MSNLTRKHEFLNSRRTRKIVKRQPYGRILTTDKKAGVHFHATRGWRPA